MLPRTRVKRFLLVTLGITGLYLGLNCVWLALTPSLGACSTPGPIAAGSEKPRT